MSTTRLKELYPYDARLKLRAGDVVLIERILPPMRVAKAIVGNTGAAEIAEWALADGNFFHRQLMLGGERLASIVVQVDELMGIAAQLPLERYFDSDGVFEPLHIVNVWAWRHGVPASAARFNDDFSARHNVDTSLRESYDSILDHLERFVFDELLPIGE